MRRKGALVTVLLATFLAIVACSQQEAPDYPGNAVELTTAEPTTVEVITPDVPAPIYSQIWDIWTRSDVDPYQWIADIEQFRSHVKRVHPKFADGYLSTLAHNISMAEAFAYSIDTLIDNVPTLTKFEILLGLQQSLGLLNDNHSLFGIASARLRGQQISFLYQLIDKRYPLAFKWLADGIYLLKAPEGIPAINQRLTAINGIPIEYVFDRFTHLWSLENIYDARNQFANYVNSPGILYALGVQHGAETRQEVVYAFYNGTYLTMYDAMLDDTLLVCARYSYDLPLFLQNLDQIAWYTFIEAYGILYIRINQYFYTATFKEDLTQWLAENAGAIEATIIDARGNSGGDLGPFLPLFDKVVAATPTAHLFYFMNEGSLSAALLAGRYFYGHGAIIIGQPSGQLLDFYSFYGTQAQFSTMLRNADFSLAVANTFHTHGTEDLVFRPHVLVEYTIDDWVNNHDPYFEYVLGLLR